MDNGISYLPQPNLCDQDDEKEISIAKVAKMLRESCNDFVAVCVVCI